MDTNTAATLAAPMTAAEFRSTLRQMMADWDAATDEQRAASLASVE